MSKQPEKQMSMQLSLLQEQPLKDLRRSSAEHKGCLCEQARGLDRDKPREAFKT
jgi:hypothetical protein